MVLSSQAWLVRVILICTWSLVTLKRVDYNDHAEAKPSPYYYVGKCVKYNYLVRFLRLPSRVRWLRLCICYARWLIFDIVSSKLSMLTTSWYIHSRTSRPEFTQPLRLRTSYVRSRHIMDLFWVAAIHIARLPTVWRVIAHAPPRASSQDLDNRVCSYNLGPILCKACITITPTAFQMYLQQSKSQYLNPTHTDRPGRRRGFCSPTAMSMEKKEV